MDVSDLSNSSNEPQLTAQFDINSANFEIDFSHPALSQSNSNSSAMPRRLPVLPLQQRSKTSTPTFTQINEPIQAQPLSQEGAAFELSTVAIMEYSADFKMEAVHVQPEPYMTDYSMVHQPISNFMPVVEEMPEPAEITKPTSPDVMGDMNNATEAIDNTGGIYANQNQQLSNILEMNVTTTVGQNLLYN